MVLVPAWASLLGTSHARIYWQRCFASTEFQIASHTADEHSLMMETQTPTCSSPNVILELCRVSLEVYRSFDSVKGKVRVNSSVELQVDCVDMSFKGKF